MSQPIPLRMVPLKISKILTKCEFTRILARRGTDIHQIHRGELLQQPIIIDFSYFQSKSVEIHPLFEIPLVAYITPQKLYVKPIKTEKKETELNFPHNAPPNGAPVSLSWNLSGRNEPKIILTHGTQLTCFLLQIDSFSSFNWIVEKIINLEEISSFVITFPRTNLILAALSPDCTAPFKEMIT